MDERAFEGKVLGMETQLYRIAYAILWNNADAADAIQESIFRAWQKQALLREEENFPQWITRILINECHSLQRRNRNRPVSFDEQLKEPGYEPPEDQGLSQALRSLPEKYRLPILLHHLDGYGLEAIASALKLPLSTVKGRLFQGRKMLKNLLDKENAL